MSGFLEKRKQQKILKEYRQLARHARNMRADMAEPKDLDALAAAEGALMTHFDAHGKVSEKLSEQLESIASKVYPNARKSFAVEWTETLIVALGAAMAIRAFFFQPFKIPTGSMQPTLNGITVEEQTEPGAFDNPITQFPKWLLTGTSYKEFRCMGTGMVESIRPEGNKYAVVVGGTKHLVPEYMRDRLLEKFTFTNAIGENYMKSVHLTKGDILISGKKIAGDHILVNKMKYNFMKPERGDISVFDTRNINYTGVRTGTFYIKRMVGLPDEKIQIQNRRLVADGAIVSEPAMFETIATDPIYSGGHNVTVGSQLEKADDFIQLGPDQYLMMGDNTRQNMSLDGRFFGGVEREMFQGPAIFVYWPFRSHWGIVR